MNILIIGDSWGTSSLSNDNTLSIENYMFSKGHYVFNKSLFGGSNMDSISSGITFLYGTKHLFKTDLIVWMFTEITRDRSKIDWNSVSSYDDVLKQLSNLTYKKIMKMKDLAPTAKWAIIGGQAAVYEPNKYDWADLLVYDWRSEILGKTLPESQCLVFQDWLLHNIKLFGIDVLEEETKKYETIIKHMKDNKRCFPDGVHPSNAFAEKMAERILSTCG